MSEIKKFLDQEATLEKEEELKATYTILDEMAEENGKRLIDESTFSWRDITEEYLVSKKQYYDKGRTLREMFEGDTRTGKSTCALMSAYEDNFCVLRHKEDSTLNKKGDINMFPLIASTPDEFVRIAKMPHIKQTALVLDEGVQVMEQGGLSSSTDQSFAKYIQQIVAEKGLHVKICSPDPRAREGCLLVHRMWANIKKEKLTYTKLYYQNFTEARLVPLGVVKWDVSDILAKDWYKLYGKKKTFAYELVLNNAIRSIRDLEFALIILIAYEHSKSLLEAGIKDVDVLSTRIDKAMKELKHLYSFIAKEELTSKLRAFCTLRVKIAESKYELTRTNRVKPLGEPERKRLEETAKVCKKDLEGLHKDYLDLIKLYIRYLSIGDNYILHDIMKLCRKYGFKVENGRQ